MSFRYKSALLSLATLALIYGWYFVSLFADYRVGVHGNRVGPLHGTILAIAVIQIIGRRVIAWTGDPRQPMDEREQGFDRRATTAGYYLLLAGTLVAIAMLRLGAQAVDMANAMLFAIVFAECMRQSVFLILHHRAG